MNNASAIGGRLSLGWVYPGLRKHFDYISILSVGDLGNNCNKAEQLTYHKYSIETEECVSKESDTVELARSPRQRWAFLGHLRSLKTVISVGSNYVREAVGAKRIEKSRYRRYCHDLDIIQITTKD